MPTGIRIGYTVMSLSSFNEIFDERTINHEKRVRISGTGAGSAPPLGLRIVRDEKLGRLKTGTFSKGRKTTEFAKLHCFKTTEFIKKLKVYQF